MYRSRCEKKQPQNTTWTSIRLQVHHTQCFYNLWSAPWAKSMYFPSSSSPHCPSLFFLARGNLCCKESWVQVCSCVTVSHSHYQIFPPLNVKCPVTLTVMCQGFLLRTVDKRNSFRKSWHYCCAFSFVALDAIHTPSNPKAKSWNQHWLLKEKGTANFVLHKDGCQSHSWGLLVGPEGRRELANPSR